MRYLRDRAFVLRRINFGDYDRVIILFTKDHGKVEVIAKGVRKITSRRSGAIELLNLIEFQAVKSRKNYILTEAALTRSFDHLKRDLVHLEKVFLMCEVIDGVMPHGVPHPEIFDLMIRAANHAAADPKTLTYFQAKLLSLLGFWDGRKSFKDDSHVRSFMEQILERKLKAEGIFA